MKNVVRAGEPKLVLGPDLGEWQALDESQTALVAKALASEARRTILKMLDDGPTRQFELSRKLSEVLGAKYTDSLLRHHLVLLERAGLVGSEASSDSPRKAKAIYRAADVRVQLRPRVKPVVLPIPTGPRAHPKSSRRTSSTC